MSQDLMQALSGSSILSLSIGTLPAGKQGMSLDSNPFASQLALMTGTDAAVPGSFAPMASAPAMGEGAFAAALDDVAAPVLADAPVQARLADAAAPGAIAPTAAPIGAVPGSATPLGVAPQIVAALPEDASASQIIEAALTGSASLDAPIVAAPVTDKRAASVQTQVAPQVQTPVTATPQTPAIATPAGTATPVTVPPVAQVPARPAAAINAPMPAEAALIPAAEPEAAADDDTAALASDTPRPQRRPRAEAAVITPEAPVAIAIVPAPVALPVAPETDIGTTRILAKAALPGEPDLAPAADQADRAPLAQPATAPADPTAQPHRQPEATIPAEIAPAPVAAPVAAAPVSAPVSATPARPAAVGATPVATAQFAPPRARAAVAQSASASPLTAPAAPVSAQAAAPVMPSAEASAPVNRVAADAVPAAAATSAPAAPVDSAMQAASPATPATPLVGNAAPLANDIAVAANAPQQVAQPAQAQNAQAQPVSEALAVPAQPAVQAQAAIQAQSVQAQSAQVLSVPSGPTLRTTAAGPRATFTPAARRVVDAAVQSARPAEALAAVFDRADLDIDPAASLARTDFAAPTMMEAIPPSWAAALNAVSSPSQQLADVAAPQASAQANATPMETLNFDAGFVANIETQIARVANGGQTVRMQIMPENLGRIDIEMLAGPERDQVRIVTEHDAVRDTLVSSQHRLEQDLRSNAQRPTEVTVELRQQSPGTQNGSAQQQQQRSQAGADTASARDAGQRQAGGDPAADAAPAARRPRGNVRYA